ncbi:hypothetical protein BM536_008255 [Streptomyces phaeoluteigriseus]|uniref:Uncharacterized protein n=1 Tax=Streptomyces phaeoluteigriseus TaxID=114686 RepID=A0A1V6MV77_9ACTN|nr:hypothetical protein [Streptomyces phaeoluteigriseus]OQD56272.1 hypothetical protein BM536_008255 [Streptomyces phaeoluteigriseus]
MRKAVALAHLALKDLREGTTVQASDFRRVPVSNHLGDGLWHDGIDHVFRPVRLVASLTAALFRPGEHKTVELLGIAVLLSRQRDGAA